MCIATFVCVCVCVCTCVPVCVCPNPVVDTRSSLATCRGRRTSSWQRNCSVTPRRRLCSSMCTILRKHITGTQGHRDKVTYMVLRLAMSTVSAQTNPSSSRPRAVPKDATHRAWREAKKRVPGPQWSRAHGGGSSRTEREQGGAKTDERERENRARRKARVGFPGTSGAHIDRGPSPDQETVRVHPPIY